MKKTNVILVMVCLVAILATSCVKENVVVNIAKKFASTATAQRTGTPNQKSSPNYSGNYSLSAKAGHNSSDCGGGCILIGGIRCHANCQGAGSICELKASVAISKMEPDNPDSFEYKASGLNDFEPTDEVFYNMPDRSFYIENSELENGYTWINIPAQLLERDAKSNQFLYTKITFSNKALFENL